MALRYQGNYTYDQFENEARRQGVYDQFSESDLHYAKLNPNYGMSTIANKVGYRDAPDDATRAKYNTDQNNLRSSMWGYTGGTDGSAYILDPLSPGNYTYGGSRPTYSAPANSDADELYKQQLGYGTYSYGEQKPAYNNRYDQQIQSKIAEIMGRDAFSYDAENDPLYSQYRKQYAREGKRSTEDTLGAVAAASGGIPSSYAATAAAQAGNYYAAQMTDKIPELEQLAYQKYLNEYNMDVSDLGVLQGAEASDYAKYQNDLAQYNTDRNFDYNRWRDGYEMLSNNYQAALSRDNLDYARYLDELAQYNTDRNFEYNQYTDELNHQTAERNEALTRAQLAAQYGDYSRLANIGVDTSQAEWEKKYTVAQLAAQYGDYSKLRELGIETNLTSQTSSPSIESDLGRGGAPIGDPDGDYKNARKPSPAYDEVYKALAKLVDANGKPDLALIKQRAKKALDDNFISNDEYQELITSAKFQTKK